ncbi:glycosyltransferase family 4 protein [Bacillus sp. JCM 19034]|uniref:glycosyltransferase family 4 protein n=1 Tax=Bacillus sp. JCM 19034 TaxID=1481928 RepID=UPI000781EE5F|nr:glycosyltransferase family 4 protein [Bacillus sp. JCM 19034]
MCRPKKIVLLGFISGVGGAQKSLIMLANELANRGYDITLISFHNDKPHFEISKKVKCEFIEDTKGGKLNKVYKRFILLKNKLNEIKPDIVISFWLQLVVFAAMMSKRIGFKTIYSERADPTAKQYSNLSKIVRSLVFRRVDGFVFQIEGAKQIFSESVQRKSAIIHNPVFIDSKNYVIPQNKMKKIVNVGRLHPQKNQELLLKAFAEISNEYPDRRLEIYGTGELEHELKQLTKELNLEGKVHFKGTSNQLFKEIVDSEMFILSSDYEGMPNALMEGMALGLPCISTDCRPGGAKELIRHKENGLLVSNGSINELAEAIRYFIRNNEEAEKMGSNAREIIKTHSPTKIYSDWEKFIAKIYNG